MRDCLFIAALRHCCEVCYVFEQFLKFIERHNHGGLFPY